MRWGDNIYKKKYDVLEIVDTIYQEEDDETINQLDGITDEFKTWAQSRLEPPDYLISVIDKIKKH